MTTLPRECAIVSNKLQASWKLAGNQEADMDRTHWLQRENFLMTGDGHNLPRIGSRGR